MTVPTRWALLWLGLAGVCCAVAVIDRRWVVVAWLMNVTIFAVVWIQGRRLRRRAVRVNRAWVGQPQANRPCTMQFIVENPEDRAVLVELRQPWPEGVEREQEKWSVHVEPRQRFVIETSITPLSRGLLCLPPLEVDVGVSRSLAAWRSKVESGGQVTVYPDLAGVRDYDRLRRSRAFRAAGFNRQRMVGVGREFEQLREYSPGDDFQDINWKATARSDEPRINLYQAERSRDVVVCLDGGRMMGNPVGRRTTLDHAVEAAMLLVHASHQQGDRVGLITFRDRVDTVIRPSTTSRPAILKTLAGFESQPVFPSYLSLVEVLRRRQTHRGLIFLLTDLTDPQLSADLVELAPTLVKRHVLVVVAMRDTLMDRVASGPAGDNAANVGRILAARMMIDDQDKHTLQLQKAGVQIVQADAQQLPLRTINQYMSIKSRQLI